MKRNTLILAVFFTLFFSQKTLKAQSVEFTLVSFNIGNEFLKDNYLKVHPSDLTSFTASATFSSLENVYLGEAYLVYVSGASPFGLETVISDVQKFSISPVGIPLVTVKFTGVLPIGTSGGKIRLRYKTGTVTRLSNVGYGLFVGRYTSGGTVDFTGGIPASLQPFAKEFGPLSSIPMTFMYPNDITPALTVGNSIYSPNQQYRFTLQTDGNLVLYKRINTTTEQALWASDKNTSLKPKSLFFQTDGNLVLYLGNSLGTGFAWAADVSATSLNLLNSQNAAYALQDDGNLVFYWLYPSGNEMFKWVFGSTGTAGGVVSPNFGRIVGAPHL